jgi:stage III sporulation protein AG
MEDNNSVVSRLDDFTKNPKFVRIIIIIGLVGIGLILLSGLFPEKSNTEENQKNSQIAYVSLTQYENNLEQSLADIISSIDGAGKTRVMLTMDSTVEQVYATDKTMSQKDTVNSGEDTETNKDISANSTYITVELSDGTQQTVLLKEIQPKVRGVLVVCNGGNNSVVKEKIVDAVTKALDISSSRVSVAGLSQ